MRMCSNTKEPSQYRLVSKNWAGNSLVFCYKSEFLKELRSCIIKHCVKLDYQKIKNIKKALTNDEKCAAALSAKADKAALVNRKIKTIYKEGTPYVITYTGIS